MNKHKMPINVLILDEEEKMKSELKRLRERFGNVDVVADAASARVSLRKRQYTVAVIDLAVAVRDPQTGAYRECPLRELFVALKGAEIAVILAESGVEPEDLPGEPLTASVDYHGRHTKPYNVEQLIGQILERSNEA